MHTFKLCDVDRTSKMLITLSDDECNNGQSLIGMLERKAKYSGCGSYFVLEENGIELKTDDTLLKFNNQVFMILSVNEVWTPAKDERDLFKPKNYYFKICNAERTKKTIICISDAEDNMYKSLLRAANLELEDIGTYIVLEQDGTVIGGKFKDGVLMKFSNKLFMILSEGQEWTPSTGNKLII